MTSRLTLVGLLSALCLGTSCGDPADSTNGSGSPQSSGSSQSSNQPDGSTNQTPDGTPAGTPKDVAWCSSDAAKDTAHVTVPIALFDGYYAGTDVQMTELHDYFANVGIFIQAKATGIAPPANYVFDYSKDEMLDDVVATYGNSPTDAQVLSIVFKHMFKTVVAFAKQASPGDVSVAFITAIDAPRVRATKSSSKVTLGIGFSDKLIREGINADAKVYELFRDAIGGDIPPMLFVGMSDLTTYSAQARYVIAHELGHSLTLPHVQDTRNLMYAYAQQLSCVPTITTAQVTTIVDASSHIARGAARDVGADVSVPWADELNAVTQEIMGRVKQ